MYLSRIEMDILNRVKMKDLNHVAAYHSWVESCFPEEIKRGIRTRKLWRIDQLKDRRYLLIVSETPPRTEGLLQYGVADTAAICDYDPFLSRLEAGLSYRFRVVLNPVVSIMDRPGMKRGRVVPHVTAEQQSQFLLDRSLKNGFSLDADQFSIVGRQYLPLKRAKERPVRLSYVAYEGRLTVTDKEQFRRTLTCGFGKKKAYGLGMMTVIPLT